MARERNPWMQAFRNDARDNDLPLLLEKIGRLSLELEIETDQIEKEKMRKELAKLEAKHKRLSE